MMFAHDTTESPARISGVGMSSIEMIGLLSPIPDSASLGPLYCPVAVPAGFPSPAQDYFTGRIDLNKHLINDVQSTFLVRVSGHSMEGAGISDGDKLVVDRSLAPADGNVVVAIVDGQLTVKRLRLERGHVRLAAENPDYPNVVIAELSEAAIWGVVTRCLHRL